MKIFNIQGMEILTNREFYQLIYYSETNCVNFAYEKSPYLLFWILRIENKKNKWYLPSKSKKEVQRKNIHIDMKINVPIFCNL